RGLFAVFGPPTEFPPLDVVTDARLANADELPDGYGAGFWGTTPLADMPRYLDYLERRFESLGGRIQLEPVRSMTQAAALAPLIAHCTGFAARELAADPSLTAVWGQHVVVENPGVDTFFLQGPPGSGQWTGFLPHGDEVIMGGVAVEGRTDLTADPVVAAGIVERCAAVDPRLAEARVIEHRVGLRPARPTVRLELEQVGSTRIVHNYGHGGGGVMLSWGTARRAAALLVG
ncbi:MAG: FAD-dependent oxidoreductase, partial [Jiangellaceae bacterium]